MAGKDLEQGEFRTEMGAWGSESDDRPCFQVPLPIEGEPNLGEVPTRSVGPGRCLQNRGFAAGARKMGRRAKNGTSPRAHTQHHRHNRSDPARFDLFRWAFHQIWPSLCHSGHGFVRVLVWLTRSDQVWTRFGQFCNSFDETRATSAKRKHFRPNLGCF